MHGRPIASGFLAFFCVLVAPLASSADETDASPSPLGRKVESFTLKDFRGKEHSLADFADKQAVVLAFLGTECPLAKLYSPRLEQLANEYEEKGVAFLGVNSNRQDSITKIAAHARVHGLSFPVLKDLGNKLADACGAERTPEVFVLDADRKIVYRGRIDDRYGIGYARNEPTRQDLKRALDQLLAGEKIEVAETEGVGCIIGRVREADANSAVTFSNQIARILQRNCVECHRAGEIAPFELIAYEEVAGWAEMIAEVVDEGRMPPWHASPEYGHFANVRRLSDEEKRQIREWVAAGAPQGDPADLPAPLEFVTGWQLSRAPDLILPMSEKPHQVPAEGTVRYQYFTIDPGFTEDKWIAAAEVQPGNRGVVHHVLVAVRTSREERARGPGEFLTAYVPGLRFGEYPAGMAKRIPAGSKLVFQVHYTPNGSPQEDVSRVGLIFADEKDLTHRIVTTLAVQPRLDIPPGEADYKAEATSQAARTEALLLGMSPHMHLRGKSFQYEAVYPDRRREVLLDVPAYDFNWQTSYRLAEPLKLPAGTRMHCVAHFDNSADNLANPDPTQRVRWGDQTWEEMMIGYFDIAIPLEAERAAEAARKAEDPAAAARQADEAQAERLLTAFDTNGDGKITRDETPEAATALFDRLDRDGDGVITRDELIEAARTARERRRE
ncbi:MAG: redoxin domain-containing protein [Planctomycetaceae bacterium]